MFRSSLFYKYSRDSSWSVYNIAQGFVVIILADMVSEGQPPLLSPNGQIDR
jgi:hypothetical protein